MTAPNVLMRGKAAAEWLEQACLAWARAFPEQFAVWRQYCEQQKHALINPNGMSRDKTCAYEGSIPTAIYNLACVKMGADFWEYPEHLRLAIQLLMGEYRPE